MAFDFQGVALVVIIVWLGALSVFIWKLHSQFGTIFKDAKDATLLSTLTNLVQEQQGAKKDITSLLARLDKVELDLLNNIQKIGLIRFNPFKDTGGDQSFIFALLDAHDSGIVLSGLFSRSGTRWYAKKVVKGKGLEHELSEEEKKAIRMAK